MNATNSVKRDESAITLHASGAVSCTGDAVHMYRVATIRSGLNCAIRTGGRMRLTREASPSFLLRLTSELTQKKYPNNAKGWALAVADLDLRLAALRASIPVIEG